jgi:hypothetical protein
VIKVGTLYLLYLPNGGSCELDLKGTSFDVKWFNPRSGGDLQAGRVKAITGGGVAKLGDAPVDKYTDSLVVVKK